MDPQHGYPPTVKDDYTWAHNHWDNIQIQNNQALAFPADRYATHPLSLQESFGRPLPLAESSAPLKTIHRGPGQTPFGRDPRTTSPIPLEKQRTFVPKKTAPTLAPRRTTDRVSKSGVHNVRLHGSQPFRRQDPKTVNTPFRLTPPHLPAARHVGLSDTAVRDRLQQAFQKEKYGYNFTPVGAKHGASTPSAPRDVPRTILPPAAFPVHRPLSEVESRINQISSRAAPAPPAFPSIQPAGPSRKRKSSEPAPPDNQSCSIPPPEPSSITQDPPLSSRPAPSLDPPPPLRDWTDPIDPGYLAFGLTLEQLREPPKLTWPASPPPRPPRPPPERVILFRGDARPPPPTTVERERSPTPVRSPSLSPVPPAPLLGERFNTPSRHISGDYIETPPRPIDPFEGIRFPRPGVHPDAGNGYPRAHTLQYRQPAHWAFNEYGQRVRVEERRIWNGQPTKFWISEQNPYYIVPYPPKSPYFDQSYYIGNQLFVVPGQPAPPTFFQSLAAKVRRERERAARVGKGAVAVGHSVVRNVQRAYSTFDYYRAVAPVFAHYHFKRFKEATRRRGQQAMTGVGNAYNAAGRRANAASRRANTAARQAPVYLTTTYRYAQETASGAKRRCVEGVSRIVPKRLRQRIDESDQHFANRVQEELRMSVERQSPPPQVDMAGNKSPEFFRVSNVNEDQRLEAENAENADDWWVEEMDRRFAELVAAGKGSPASSAAAATDEDGDKEMEDQNGDGGVSGHDNEDMGLGFAGGLDKELNVDGDINLEEAGDVEGHEFEEFEDEEEESGVEGYVDASSYEDDEIDENAIDPEGRIKQSTDTEDSGDPSAEQPKVAKEQEGQQQEFNNGAVATVEEKQESDTEPCSKNDIINRLGIRQDLAYRPADQPEFMGFMTGTSTPDKSRLRLSSTRHSTRLAIQREREEAERRAEEEALAAAAKAAEEEREARLRCYRKTPTASVFPPLPAGQDAKVDAAMAGSKPDKTVGTIGRTQVTRGEFDRLLPDLAVGAAGAWLNDSVVDAGAQVSTEYILDKLEHKRGTTPKVHSFTSHFIRQLQEKGVKGVKSWTQRQKIRKDTLLGMDTIFFPVNVGGSHWTLLVVCPTKRVVEYYDSFSGKGTTYLRLMKTWLQSELEEKYVDDEWTFRHGVSPRQNNGCDCGVFVVSTVRCIAMGWHPESSYTADDMATQRRRIAAEIIQGRLGGELEPIVAEGRWRELGLDID